MLMLNKKLTENFGLTANAGWSARTEKVHNVSVGTNGGLSVENWFHLNASQNKANSNMNTSEFLKTAAFATVGVSWKNYLFLEGTGRQEKTSTLASGSNTFFYPPVNASFFYI